MADRDAAFREALDAYTEEVFDHCDLTKPPNALKMATARARVLALYAERQGEVYEVVENGIGNPPAAIVPIFDGELKPGDRVRVTRIEEAS